MLVIVGAGLVEHMGHGSDWCGFHLKQEDLIGKAIGFFYCFLGIKDGHQVYDPAFFHLPDGHPTSGHIPELTEQGRVFELQREARTWRIRIAL